MAALSRKEMHESGFRQKHHGYRTLKMGSIKSVYSIIHPKMNEGILL
jgi:hypothetical protein